MRDRKRTGYNPPPDYEPVKPRTPKPPSIQRTEKELKLLAEKIRFANSSDFAYQNMLNVIASAVEKEFGSETKEVRIENIVDFIKTWRP